MIEVERKAWLRDLKDMESRIQKVARFLKNRHLIDFYYAPRGDSDPVNNCFRIRLDNGKGKITFKEKRILRQSEVNEENTVEINDPLFLARLLDEAGFEMFIWKEKRSRIYRNNQNPHVTIELNEVDQLGCFIEMEIMVADEKAVPRALRELDRLFYQLKINSSDIESRLYIEILLEKNRGWRYRFNPRARSLLRAYLPVRSRKVL